jgi:ubiquinone/menaquinone biosynthesis C-methylase UbiE
MHPSPANLSASHESLFVLDIGGEGRHVDAWNLNPSKVRTFGPQRGERVPRLIVARGDAIPLADQSVDVIIVERTPLRLATLREMLRVARPSAQVILRHVVTPAGDPHRVALRSFSGRISRQFATIGIHRVQETVIQLGQKSTVRDE